MFDNEISSHQNACILILISFVFQTMFMPNILSAVDGPVGWVSIIIGSIILLLTISPINKVMNNYEGKTIIGISRQMFPEYISKLIGVYYILLFVTANSVLIKDFAEQIKYLMLFNTPIKVLIISILLTASYAAKKGMQTIAQITHITILIALIPYIVVIIFSTYYSDYTNVFPIYPVDLYGVVNSIPTILISFFGYTILMFSNRHVDKSEKNMVLNKKFIIISMVLYIASYLLIIIKFGTKEATHLVWPYLSIMKFVNIPGFFFESTEIVGLSLQIIVTFTCVCILMYFTNLAIQETFETREIGYFTFIQIPVVYILAGILPGMYMLHPYIKIPSYFISALNILIPLFIVFWENKRRRLLNK